MLSWSRGKMFNLKPLAKTQIYLPTDKQIHFAKSILLKGWLFLGVLVHLLLLEESCLTGCVSSSWGGIAVAYCTPNQCLYHPQVMQITIFRSCQQHRGDNTTIAQAPSLLLVSFPALARDYCFNPVKVVNKSNVCNDRCWNPERQLLPVAKHFQDVVP